ncbi:MAG: thiol:disulfide interchange protein/DsbC/DsbD-like thiol-disulfide interchange protein [Polaromonas sp.]|jgi:thiol:disulfide interchange protein/DsbC/DsbD-like thiol-disulfide interchange protein
MTAPTLRQATNNADCAGTFSHRIRSDQLMRFSTLLNSHLKSRLVAAALLGSTGFVAAPVAAQSTPSLFSTSTSSDKASSVVTTDEVRAELMVHAPQGVSPGQPLWVGLNIAHQPEWHTYWKNSGDSGLPTELRWTLPAGVTAGEIAWPTPKKIPIGNLANYGYENTILLPVPLTVAPGFSASQLTVQLSASWLVCKQECIPQQGEFTLTLPVRSSSAANGRVFEAAWAASPRALAGGSGQINVETKAIGVSVAGLPAAWRGQALDFYPETGGVTEPAGTIVQAWKGGLWTAQVPLSAHRSDSPQRMPVVLALADGKGTANPAWRIELPVRGAWPSLAAPIAVPAALEAALKANAAALTTSSSAPALTWLVAILGALLGGLILNLMPCVFPVLAIKMVGFMQVKDQTSRTASGVAYTAGVVLSFLALGGLLLGLRAAGEQLGWGFQLQSPAVVAGLAALFTLLGLNLAGLFEFGQLLPSRLASLQSKNITVNSFLSGVLATAIASPCTAPFMGASLGLAVGLPALQALAIFGAIGVGMALPYLAASLVPAVARAMPRPGAWMVTFKTFMAFPMFATVAWLVWILGQQSGINGAGTLLGLLVLMALVIWTFTLTGKVRVVAVSLSLLTAALALSTAGPSVVKLMELGPTGKAAISATERWQPWAPGRVEQLTGEGRSVLVDFTAAWCVTCQYNKTTTLSNRAVLADVDAKNVALLRADWTRRDPAVTAALKELGRSGVPVYVIYKAGRAPVVMSEILSVDDVRRELARL